MQCTQVSDLDMPVQAGLKVFNKVHATGSNGAVVYSGLQKCCNVLQFQIVCSVALYDMEITLSIIERK
jgi:hypothetical protein